MKYLFLFCLFFSVVSAFAQQTVVLPDSIGRETEAFQLKREEWIRSMHRAEPGLNWKVIDEQIRDAKAEAYYSSRRLPNTFSPQATTQDTFAAGKIVGSWSERGSKNVCGRTHTADIDFATNTIYVASSMGNIWKAELESSDWTCLNDAHRFGDIRMLRQIITPGGKRLIAASSGPTVVRYSDDDGISWKEALGLDGPKSWGGTKRAVTAADEKTIYLVGSEWDYSSAWRSVSFLYRSTDHGAHFTKIGNWNVSSNLCDVWVSRDTTSAAYFIKEDSLFMIASNGKLQFLSQRSVTGSSLLLDGKVEHGITTLALAETANGTTEVFTTTGTMQQWESHGTVSGWPFTSNSFRISVSSPLQFYFGTNELHQWTFETGNFSVPTGWAEYYGDPAKKLHADITGVDIFRDPTGKELTLISTDGGTYLSNDRNKNVQNLTLDGIRTSQYYSTYTSSPPYMINAGSQDQGFQRGAATEAGLLDMDQIISGDYGHIVSSDSGNSVWGDYPGFVIYYPNARTSKNSRSWDFKGSNHLWMPPVIAVPGNPKKVLVACGEDGSDASTLWQLTASGSSIASTMLQYDFSLDNPDRRVSAVAFSPFDTTELYAASNDGYFYHSTSSGQNWTNSDTNTLPGSHYFYGSTILPSKRIKGTLWVAGSGYSNPGVYLSTDNGASFVAADSGLPKTLTYGLVASNDEKFLFAATEVGPYIYSVEAGRWFDLLAATGIAAPDMVYWSVEKIPQSNTIRFGTYGRGIWDFTFDTVKPITISVKSNDRPASVSLHAVPSISSSLVHFEHTSSHDATMSIYDIEGRMVKQFVANGEEVIWDASVMPTGFYTVILRSGSEVAFTKVQIIR